MSESLVKINNKSTNSLNTEDRAGLYIKTFGCQMNVYDSHKLEKILEEQYKIVSVPEEADLILINTCSVRDKAEHKLYSLLGKLKKIRDTKPNLLIGV